MPLQFYLYLSAFLFSIGIGLALSRKNSILILAGIELILAAANLNFLAFWKHSSFLEDPSAPLFALFVIAIAASEAALGLALIIHLYRHTGSTSADSSNQLQG
ncbi:MAG: NADH-quinone oxidoreductase subunit NuoK [Chthoniobacterales bacterium]|nr:NADH-quinone oxidoreductase subunit NuoK [Chthoniobacterales bacterium]